jgi:hypothetical protein
VSLGSAGVEVSANGVTNSAVSVTIPSGCSYTTDTGPTWISVVSGGSGNASGALVYSVAGNAAAASRTANISVGGTPFQITQDAAPCQVTVDPSALPAAFAVTGGSGTINISTNGASCSWSASSPVPWATLTQSSGTGAGSTMVNVASNAASSSPRTASLTVSGQGVNIAQNGTSCSYTLTSTAGSVPATGGNSSVGIVTPAACAWTSISSNTSWLNITSNGSSGSPAVQFSAAANSSSTARSATITINATGFSGTYTVMQAGAPCSFTLNQSSSGTLSSGGASGSFNFTASALGCPLVALSYSSWISIGTVPNGDGLTGAVNYSVPANPNGATRSGTIEMGNTGFVVSQTGATCAFSLNAAGQAFNLNGGTGAVQGSPSANGCSPTVGTSQPSIVTIGTLSGPVSDIFTLPFTVSPFSSVTPVTRRANITFGGQIYAIKQTSY